MLIFASGRTDIPAFYSQWFMERLRAGYVDVRNPYCREKVNRYALNPKLVDCIVFCTKNPEPMFKYLEEIKSLGFSVYFFVTITPYGKDVEPFVPSVEESINSFISLSKAVGTDNICWRYDPIFTSETYPVSLHLKMFRHIAESLSGFTNRCIISFIDIYKKTEKNFPGIKEVSKEDQFFIAETFSRIGHETDIKIETCAEKNNFSKCGISSPGCINKDILEKAINWHIIKNPGVQHLRKYCTCLPMTDIGAYNSCPHLCKYCYANFDSALVEKNFKLHDSASSFLIGNANQSDIFKEAAQKSFKDEQLFLF